MLRSYRHPGVDVRVGVIAVEADVLEAELEQVLD
jgi:hypothetical protein